jgi:hypothetical protein
MKKIDISQTINILANVGVVLSLISTNKGQLSFYRVFTLPFRLRRNLERG